jgi:hypothetical protein
LDSPVKVYRSLRRYNPPGGCIGVKALFCLIDWGHEHELARMTGVASARPSAARATRMQRAVPPIDPNVEVAAMGFIAGI